MSSQLSINYGYYPSMGESAGSRCCRSPAFRKQPEEGGTPLSWNGLVQLPCHPRLVKHLLQAGSAARIKPILRGQAIPCKADPVNRFHRRPGREAGYPVLPNPLPKFQEVYSWN